MSGQFLGGSIGRYRILKRPLDRPDARIASCLRASLPVALASTVQGLILKKTILLGCVFLFLSACGGRAYVHEALDLTDIRARAETLSDGPIRVSAAVPGREETRAIFGIDLYDQGVQPVWLKIENSGNAQARYAPVSTDRDYFSPLEVVYKNRGGFSGEASTEMGQRFDALAMPRYIDPGEARSGFVLTHADSGAKGFNVDLFSSGDSFQFTFLLRVPGFVPDYANVDFASIYREDQLNVYHDAALKEAVRNLPCCSSGQDSDDAPGAINIVLVGEGSELLRALLRSGWIETDASEATDNDPDLLFGRQQDAIFRYESRADDSFYELRLWLTPMLHATERVWAGQVMHFFKPVASLTRLDPDVDHARSFVLQNLAYGQALAQYGWIAGEEVVPVQSFWSSLVRPAFFTDGYRSVLWLSGEPISILEIGYLDWDEAPGWKR